MAKYKRNWIYNKTVVISGASSGMGREVAKILINNYNCKVIGIGRSQQKMLTLTEELGINKDKFSYQLFDVSKEENWINFKSHLETNNIIIDLLINNAGVLPPFKSFEKHTVDEIKYTFDVNFFASIYSITHLTPILEKSNTPAIINIASSAALCPIVGGSVYSASKAALKNYTETIRAEYKHKMYIGLICPGLVKTNLFRNQTREKHSIVDKISMNSTTAAKKIVNGIRKQKRRHVIGIDARFMDMLYRVFPRSSANFIKIVLKSSKLDLFNDIFN